MNFIQKTIAWYRRPHKSTVAQYVEAFIVILPIAFVIRTYFYGLYQVPTGSMETTMLVGERFFADKFTILFSAPKRGDIITFNDPRYPYSNNRFKRLFERYVWGPSNWTKRVIGAPGDHVQGKVEDGVPVVYLNGEKLHEPYLNKHPLIAVYRESMKCDIEFRSWDRDVAFDKQPFYAMTEYQALQAARLLRTYPEKATLEPYTPTYDNDGSCIDEFDVTLAKGQYWAMGDNRKYSHDSRAWGPLDEEFIHGKIVLRVLSFDSHDQWLIFDLIKNPIDFFKRIRWSRFLQRVY